ncbi:hypothetical protein ARAF_2625 [Arsenophonus endosymbiont of Aleurodicus floccissimus]|uniref:DUF4224 domain-containing protein n=1 Tax=Arsenophonus endosymbiont of Aleurodicus floccissimus TaxID=2152761 RepID=UPI000E6B36B0|nr:DUF4224 domain-containing protein [Arsenophonus endosymbiont of Aleurodicus floccissimus]SPP32460.1 hypothetical protein ARAF_2625 [Arsenophonus endosymbiont of Aleurodicus floccissimus]
MKSENDIISDDELEKITGFQLPNKQVEKLIEARVWFVKNRDDKPRTTWYHFNHPLKFRTPNLISEPNWGAMKNGKTT